MSDVNYLTTNAGVAKWTPDSPLFTTHHAAQGPIAVWHGQAMGGSSAYALLGPDHTMAGVAAVNNPTATGPGWNMPWGNAAAGGPNVEFATDVTHFWIRGHLVNAAWGGSGANWNNLTALTPTANANHATIENGLKLMLLSFYNFDRNPYHHRTYGYALRYYVQVSITPFAAPAALAGNLYSYAPTAIRVSWRVVRVTKPANLWPHGAAAIQGVPAWIDANCGLGSAHVVAATAANIAVDFPGINIGAVIPVGGAGVTVLPALGNAALAAGLFRAVPAGVPPIGAVGAGASWDGEAQINQT